MKVNEVLFLIGIVLLVIGAGTALLPLMGAGALVFGLGLIVRLLTRPREEQQAAEEPQEDVPDPHVKF
jgi:hypothetical protein